MHIENNSVNIVVPIYKRKLHKNEIISINRLIKILNKYPITFIKSQNLPTNFYEEYFNKVRELNIISFEPLYFKNIEGYNRLLLSQNFYEKFRNFEYILIYQLDAYVFKDELAEWCSRGYDYLGAPWFTSDNRFKGNSKRLLPWKTGNGGLSLRNVEKFLNVLMKKGRNESLNTILKSNIKGRKSLLSIVNSFRHYFSKQNSINFFIDKYSYAEDRFWSFEAERIYSSFNVAPASEALKFCFEKYPSESYKINNSKLPFGCHAWEKHNGDFWKKFINA